MDIKRGFFEDNLLGLYLLALDEIDNQNLLSKSEITKVIIRLHSQGADTI